MPPSAGFNRFFREKTSNGQFRQVSPLTDVLNDPRLSILMIKSNKKYSRNKTFLNYKEFSKNICLLLFELSFCFF